MPANSIRSAKRRDLYRMRGRHTHEHYDDLRIITCNVPELDLSFIDKFIISGMVPSRSEYIRVALRDKINKDIEIQQAEYDIVEEKIKLDPEKFVIIPGYNGNKPVEIIRRLE